MKTEIRDEADQSKLLSQTPKTEAAEFFIANADRPEERWRCVDAKFARQLEHENTVLRNTLSAIVEAASAEILTAAPHKRTEGQKLIAQALAALKPHSP